MTPRLGDGWVARMLTASTGPAPSPGWVSVWWGFLGGLVVVVAWGAGLLVGRVVGGPGSRGGADHDDPGSRKLRRAGGWLLDRLRRPQVRHDVLRFAQLAAGLPLARLVGRHLWVLLVAHHPWLPPTPW